MRVNQISDGFPHYLSHRGEYYQQKQDIFSKKIELNSKRNIHQNIFSDQYHNLPQTQVKNPFLRQEFKIGEVRKQWDQLVYEKTLPPIEVYDCVLDQTQTVPRETFILKNKDLYPQYYQEALNEQGKVGFRRQQGAFMQQIQEINKVLPIIDQFKTPKKQKIQQTANEIDINVTSNNISSRGDLSVDKQQKSYQYQSRPSLLRQSMMMEKTDFFTPKNVNSKQLEIIAEYKRDQYLSHDPKYINEVEHKINKELINDQINQKSKSTYRLQKDLKGQFELKKLQNQLESSPSEKSFQSLEKINDLKRSIEFKQFEDELTKFENSLKANKKSNFVWMKNSINNSKSNINQSSFSLSPSNRSPLNYYQPQIAKNSISKFSKEIQENSQQNESNSPEPNQYNFNFNPKYSFANNSQKIDSITEINNNNIDQKEYL